MFRSPPSRPLRPTVGNTVGLTTRFSGSDPLNIGCGIGPAARTGRVGIQTAAGVALPPLWVWNLGVRVKDFVFWVSGSGVRISGFRSRFPGFEFWVSFFGLRGSNFGFRVAGFEFRVSFFGFRGSSFGFRFSGSGGRISGFRFRVPRFEFRVLFLGCRGSNFGFRVSGSKVRISGFGFRSLRCPGSWFPH